MIAIILSLAVVTARRAEPIAVAVSRQHHARVRRRRRLFDRSAATSGPPVAGRFKDLSTRTGVPSAAHEAMLQHAAGEEPEGVLPYEGTPWAILAGEAVVVDRLQAVQLVRHQPQTRRRLGGVVACKSRAPRVPGRQSALRVTGAPSMAPTRARPVTIPVPDEPCRRNVGVAQA